MKQVNHIYQNTYLLYIYIYLLYIQNKISPELLDHSLQRE